MNGNNTGPVVFNVQATGYYRVNYDQESWRRIADTLKLDKDLIHPLNRAQIICDVVALADTGYVSTEIRDDVLAYIDSETDFGPLYASTHCVPGLKLEEPKVLRI